VLAGIDHILEKPTGRGKEWMATIFKNKYAIDPLTISQTHLNSYRKQSNARYNILKSDLFENERLQSLDYLILNNKIDNSTDDIFTFSYKNQHKSDVQVTLFYENEIQHTYDYINKIPYFTTVLESGKKYDLPFNKKVKIYLYTFDKNGKRIDNQIITPEKNT